MSRGILNLFSLSSSENIPWNIVANQNFPLYFMFDILFYFTLFYFIFYIVKDAGKWWKL